MKIKLISVLILLNVIFCQSFEDLNEARKIYEDYKSNDSNIQNQIDFSETLFDSTMMTHDTLFQKRDFDYSVLNSRYFGYDYFTKRDSIRIWPVVSIPEDYVLGPGDNLEITIWGRAQLNNKYTINREGNIYDKSIGVVSLDGKRLKEARILLKERFSERISSLEGKIPTTFIYINLGKLKSINVHFVGRVNYPGVHLLHPLSSVINGLLQAGGVDTTGTLRKIQLKRNGKLFKEIDLYNFLMDGDNSEDIILQNNDIVAIPTRSATIQVLGEVYNPAIFEALHSENLGDILKYAGGLKPIASEWLTLKRIVPISERVKGNIPSKQDLMINYNKLNDQQIMDGDILSIFPLPDLINHVRISGQVKLPREYLLTDSLTLKELLIRAGGIEDKNYLKSTFMDRIEVLRIDPTNQTNKVIEISLYDIVNSQKYDNLYLQKDDHVVVHKNINYSDEHIIIDGEINVPGLYSLTKSDRSLKNIIDMAGGLTDNAYVEGIKVYRDKTKLIWDDFKVTLQDADSIYVPEKPYAIEVVGEVYNPGYIHYKRGKSVRRYIESAGGVKPTGNRRSILVTYPNGDVKTNSLFPRKVVDGCTITVNTRPENEPIDVGDLVRDTISLTTSILLTWVAIERIR